MKALLALGFLHFVVGMPATLDDLMMVDDTMSVGSYVRETRAAPPDNYHKSYQSEGDGEVGYSRKKTGGGKKGYQHFDSFHKKAGDNYEFEKQDSYGQDDEGHDAAYSNRDERRAERKPDPEADDGEHEVVHKKEKQHEELKEGASDGNGGVEAHGHNPKDYVLPAKYTYGSGEEYDF